ncbi:MAG: universal stress protein UspE [Succinivibrio sp.]|nr:universal stress protein UspE [Succinivibrio sp.]
MKHYNHLLVVVEPKRERQVALERALEIAQYNPKLTITVLRLVYDFSYELHILNRLKEKETRDDVLQTHEDKVNQLIEEYRQDKEVTIIPKVVFARDIADGIIQELKSGGYDLVIKAANHHGVLDSIIFTPVDWYLLRNANVPVIIAKEHSWGDTLNIVVAVDFTFNRSNRTNIVLLREAQILAAITGGTIHLVNSAPVVLPSVMLEVPHYAPEVYAKSVVEEHRQRLLKFAQQHNIPEEHCHLGEGMPDDVIPEICRKIEAKVVFIGSAGRSGAMAAFIGNTCEEIVDFIDADLIVLNNKTIGENKSAKA